MLRAVTDAETPTESDEKPARPPRDWTRFDQIALITVTLVAGVLRLVRLADPDSLVFDEEYYAKDSCWYVHVSDAMCDRTSEVTQVHPPLGKWLLAIGIRLFGYNTFGWRIMAVVAGTVTVALLYLLARKLLGSTLGATIASGLLALDFLHFVQSRVAMLDVFAVAFGVAAVLFVVYDRDRILTGQHEPRGLLERPWRIAAGAAAGAATASKWSGAFFLVLVIVLTVAWEVSARRRAGAGFAVAIGRAFLQEAVTIVVWFVLLPIAVYAFTYIGRLEWSEGTWVRALWDRQKYMADFHSKLGSHHSYESPAWSWLLLKRPVSYFFETDSQGRYKEIFASGNPFVWWPALLALLYAAVRWVRKPVLGLPEGVIIGGFALTYLVWLPIAATSGREATFLFYLLPAIPFMCLALGYIAVMIGNSWEAKAAISLFAAGTIGLFAFYYPLLTQVAIPQDDWDRRIWIFDNCDPGEGIETTSVSTVTNGRMVRTRTNVTTTTESLPPPGWCWI